MSEWIVPSSFLVALANRLFASGRKVLTVHYPLYGHELFSIDNSFHVTSPTTFEKFRDARDAATSYEPDVKREAPDWGDVVDCFASSGAIPPPNLTELATWAADALEDQRSPQKAARPLFLAVDTNIAHYRLFSRHFPLQAPNGQPITATTFQFLISETVRREIDGQIQRKYRGELNRLFTKPGQEPFVREIGGRNVLVARKGKLAQNEIDYLDKQLMALSVSSPDYSGDKEKRDITIAQTYGTFAQERNVEVALLTMDQNMVDHAKNAKIRCFPLQVIARPDLKSVDLHYSLAHLLHDLAVVLGVLVIEPFKTTVWGEWPGKTSADYAAEWVKVVLDDKAPIAKYLELDFEVCAKMLGVSIEA